MEIKGSMLAQRTCARCKKNIHEQHRLKPHMLSVPEQKAFRIAWLLWLFFALVHVQFLGNLRGKSTVCAKCFG